MNSNQLLVYISDELDISNEQLAIVKSAYESVGNWLDQGEELHPFSPTLFAQGSIALGTTVKPVGKKDEYDVDMVCLLRRGSTTTSPEIIKRLVGDRLKGHGTYCKMLDEEGKRCWTLQYSDATRFHMDILPSVPESALHESFSKTAKELVIQPIAATNKDDIGTYDYVPTNPKGYIEWFHSCMERNTELTKRFSESIQQLPQYPRKTPLQRAVQLLKRHRDVMFDGDAKKPISIILTTVAGLLYNGEANVISAINNILTNAPRAIQRINGEFVLCNPARQGENFCEKWNTDNSKAQAFYTWIRQAQSDFDEITNPVMETVRFSKFLEDKFERGVVLPAYEKYASGVKDSRVAGALGFDRKTGIIGATGAQIVKDHTFFGNE